MTDLADGAVVARVRSGDRDAFGLLVERYQDRMVAHATYMGLGRAEALDVVQDAFVRAYRHLDRCGDPERFGGWLFRIVSNQCRTAAKRASRRMIGPLEPHVSSLASEAAGPDERLEAGRVRERVRAALRTVPDEQREALVLMYLDGLSVGEISDMTGASPSAVKMRLKRGRERLKAELAPLVSEGREP
jgi:RNA polymerase sigma-70 factor (ECF subfamily)